MRLKNQSALNRKVNELRQDTVNMFIQNGNQRGQAQSLSKSPHNLKYIRTEAEDFFGQPITEKEWEDAVNYAFRSGQN